MSVAVFGEKARALVGLTKGAEVYVEPPIPECVDRAQRTELAVAAWEVLPLARIGRNRPKKPRPEQTEAPPFDDDLSF